MYFAMLVIFFLYLLWLILDEFIISISIEIMSWHLVNLANDIM
jgi:hypothetical protein